MWIIPTLSRPLQVKELILHAHKLDPTSTGMVFVNGRDHVHDYVKHVGNHLPDGWEMILHDKNLGAIGALNYVFGEYPDEKFYGFIGDDEFVNTKDWSKDLVNAAGDWSLSHANDGWQSGARIHSFVCIGGELARCAEMLGLPSCWHWYGFDSMWEEIAKDIPIKNFLTHVKTEHRHHLRHSVKKDDCYDLGDSKKEEDAKAFDEWMKEEKPNLIEKIRSIREV